MTKADDLAAIEASDLTDDEKQQFKQLVETFYATPRIATLADFIAGSQRMAGMGAVLDLENATLEALCRYNALGLRLVQFTDPDTFASNRTQMFIQGQADAPKPRSVLH